MRRNETDLIKSKSKRWLTAKGYKFVSRVITIAAEQNGLHRLHPEFKAKKEQLYKLLENLIIDKGHTIEDIKSMVQNRKLNLTAIDCSTAINNKQ